MSFTTLQEDLERICAKYSGALTPAPSPMKGEGSR